MANNNSWKKIFDDYNILQHDFDNTPYLISASDIKISCQDFRTTGEKEVRVLCKQDTREHRPQIFKDNNLFLLPVKNGYYNIIKGEGYIDIPEITSEIKYYSPKLEFELETSKVGNSEMQHLDYAYAVSLIRTFMVDPTLVLTIRGRKFTPTFEFNVRNQHIKVESVQTEVDGGYEGEDKVVLIEAKSSGTKNTIIRQLYYPYRQWQTFTRKKIYTLFFEKDVSEDLFSMWVFEFTDVMDYNSIKFIKSERFKLQDSR